MDNTNVPDIHVMIRPSFLDQKSEVASIRSNNPGAMWPGPSSRKFGEIGSKALNDGLGQGNKIAYFDDAIDGAAALFDLLGRVYTGLTVRKAIAKWSGGNWVTSYLKVLKAEAGIDPETQITKHKIRDPEWAVPFAMAMAKHEAGKDYPLEDEHWRIAHSEAFSSIPSVAQERAQEQGKVAVTEATKKSWTIRGALISALGTVVLALQQAVEFAASALQATTELGPIKQLAASLGHNVPAVGYGLAAAGLIIVIYRRLVDAATGKTS